MARRQLALGTISLAGRWTDRRIRARFREIYRLSASQSAYLVAVPVLLGSLARIPMGLRTDRWQGRFVFAGLMLFAAETSA